MGDMDETGLLERARNGNEHAFSELFSTHQRRLFRYAAYMAGADAADDIVQDTFLAVLGQRDRHDQPTGTVASYLIGIARHLVMKRHERTAGWSLVADDDLDRAPSAEPDALDRLLAAESVDSIRAAVLSLPPVYREAVVLCELEDLDYAGAAAVMQCPVGTVRSRLSRARGLLAQKLTVTLRDTIGERR